MKYCSRCCYPENTRPYIEFDDNGVCSGCRAHDEYVKRDFKTLEKELEKIADEYKGSGTYDCIIPVSGGKDSYFQVWYAIEKLKLNPLLVSYDHGYHTELIKQNLENLCDRFGVDCHIFRTNKKTAKKFSLYFLKKIGDITGNYHFGIPSFPIQVAKELGIKLVIFGENAQYLMFGNPEKNYRKSLTRGLNEQDLLKEGFTESEIKPLVKPDYDIKQIFLGDYTYWDAAEHVKIAEKYGFRYPSHRECSYYLYEHIDDGFQDVHNYCKYIKFGYGRITDQVSREIRFGRMTRDRGFELIRQLDGKRPSTLDDFLGFAGITEEHFLECLKPLSDN